MVGSRGFEPRSARSERAASANCATSRWWPRADSNRHWTGSQPVASARIGLHGHGPSGWTRTTTTRVKSPACCIDTTEGVELIPGIEPGRRPYQGRRLPLHQISIGASGRIRTGRHRVGSPRSYRWTTLALVRPRGDLRSARSEFGRSFQSRPLRGPPGPAPPRWQRGMLPPHPGRTWTGVVHRPIDTRQLSKTPLLRAARTARIWRQRQDSNLDLRVLEAPMLPFTPRCRIVTSRRPL
jgi:hypothetical protein